MRNHKSNHFLIADIIGLLFIIIGTSGFLSETIIGFVLNAIGVVLLLIHLILLKRRK